MLSNDKMTSYRPTIYVNCNSVTDYFWPTITTFLYLLLFFYCGRCYEETTEKEISYFITTHCWWHMNLGTPIWKIHAQSLGFPLQTITSILPLQFLWPKRLRNLSLKLSSINLSPYFLTFTCNVSFSLPIIS